MTTSLAHHDSHGDGYLRDGIDSNSPLELVESDKEDQNYASVIRTPATEVLDPMGSSDVDDEERMEPNGRPNHAGFWHPSMVNVRLHVLKLWARTGKIRELHFSSGGEYCVC